MERNAKIKVIKKGEQKIAKPVIDKTTPKSTAHELVTNVSSWVTEFQHRRREETKQAFEKLLNQQSQPTLDSI